MPSLLHNVTSLPKLTSAPLQKPHGGTVSTIPHCSLPNNTCIVAKRVFIIIIIILNYIQSIIQTLYYGLHSNTDGAFAFLMVPSFVNSFLPHPQCLPPLEAFSYFIPAFRLLNLLFSFGIAFPQIFKWQPLSHFSHLLK